MRGDVALLGSEGRGDSAFMRHVLACGNAVLPGNRLPFRLGAHQVGWVRPDFAAALAAEPGVAQDGQGVCLLLAGALPDLARRTADCGLHRWRNEAFDVRESTGGPVLAQIDRGALPAYGIEAVGVHVNGIVEGPDGPSLWVARRAPSKALDPNKLDHIVAGGVPAGLTPEETLVKEAREEASIPDTLARQARQVGVVRYAMERFEGLRRDTLLCYDLVLPDHFRPTPGDDEVAGFELWPLRRVAETVAAGDAFKFNVNLVLIDLLIRRRIIRGVEAATLREALGRIAAVP